VKKAALDSVPALRLAAIDALHRAEGELTTTEVATLLEHPTQTTRRALEDATAHGIMRRESGGDGKADKWRLSGFAAERYAEALTVPEMSGGGNA